MSRYSLYSSVISAKGLVICQVFCTELHSVAQFYFTLVAIFKSICSFRPFRYDYNIMFVLFVIRIEHLPCLRSYRLIIVNVLNNTSEVHVPTRWLEIFNKTHVGRSPCKRMCKFLMQCTSITDMQKLT